MADVYMYADETGNLDYEGVPSSKGGGASAYFGFGTAVFSQGHGEHLLDALHLRAECEAQGANLSKGFHAYDDSKRTRSLVFELIRQQAPRFDATFLYKANAYPYVKQAGEMRLYKMAWFLHFKEIATQVCGPNDRLFVIVGEFGTAKRRIQAKEALKDVCSQMDRQIILCIWTAASAWGIQAADYGLWATQRILEGKPCQWYQSCVQPTLHSVFKPWGGPRN
ncbi:hypothetical protein KIH27_02140 [Mycobacterium sp. M1]|uniref:DUF3800 domain-containing protein n=1 Tax=Mycolicibacter acidiphilus TaxID=2835306 RepID=A0ABS5RDM6_9MYCO|nr:hypothetical protein [Mycolicibacter acidiphilus]MBS9532385.1 hypothetical protein [Mycolicibacter acidiphilus]